MTLIPTQITFRGLPHSDALELDIRGRIESLALLCGGIVRCRALVELPHRRRHAGRPFRVRIEIAVRRGELIVVSHEPSLHAQLKHVDEIAHRKETQIDRANRYASVAVREAFDAARRRLDDFAHKRRGAVRTHHVAEIEATH